MRNSQSTEPTPAKQLAQLNQLRAEGLVAEGVYTPMKAYYERQLRNSRLARITTITTTPRTSR